MTIMLHLGLQWCYRGVELRPNHNPLTAHQYATLLFIKLTHQVSKVPVLELLTVIMCSYLLMVLHLDKPIELNLVVRKVVADEQKHLLEDVDADVGVTTDEVQEGVAAAVGVQEMVFLELGGFEEVVKDLWRCVDYSNF